MQKLDPYINVDPGTMSPYQHGEVYVLDDGSETDLDLGHYERFTNSPLTRDSNYTTGQIYLSVINKERRGEFLGKTVQVIPHITNEIKSCHRTSWPTTDVDVVITEIGGTVGDIESQPFLEAIRQFALDVGKENCLYIHLTLVPYLKAAGELKTKPTQHSVGQLRQIGIQPDILICRTERSIWPRRPRKDRPVLQRAKIEAVIEEKDKDFSIYEVPLSLVENKLDELIVEQLGLHGRHELESRRLARLAATAAQSGARNHASPWSANMPSTATPTSRSTKSLDHAGIAPSRPDPHPAAFKAKMIETRRRRTAAEPATTACSSPAASASAASKARSRRSALPASEGIPFFGICLGMQCAVIEFARNVIGLDGAHSTEFDKDTPHPVICLLDEQTNDHRQRRHDAAGRSAGDARARQPSAAKCYGSDRFPSGTATATSSTTRYRQQFAAHGMLIAGTSPDGSLVEVVETARAPVVRGRAVPSGIQIEADASRIRCLPASSAPPSHATRAATIAPAAKKPTEKTEKSQEPQKTQSPNPSPT